MSQSQQCRPDRPADHVEPADRRGRGAGADAAAHGLQPDRARVRRPLGRRLRPQGPHAGAGRHRHAGPRQLHGRVGEALHRHFPLETMQPGDAYITNDPWMGTGHLNDFVITTPCFHKGKLVGAVLLHLPPDGHRRHRLRAGRHRRVHGGPLHPVAQAARPGQGQRDADGDDPRQHAPARRHRWAMSTRWPPATTSAAGGWSR